MDILCESTFFKPFPVAPQFLQSKIYPFQHLSIDIQCEHYYIVFTIFSDLKERLMDFGNITERFNDCVTFLKDFQYVIYLITAIMFSYKKILIVDYSGS